MTEPLAYLITWTCYGTWLHGDERGSVGRHGQNGFGHPLVSGDSHRHTAEASRLPYPPFVLTADVRPAVLAALREVADHRGWVLYAAHVRSNHVHTVVGGTASPERMLNDFFKGYASRRLNTSGTGTAERPKWTRHGSTRYLWKPKDLEAAIRYVVEQQGESMEVWCSPEWRIPTSGS